MDRGPLFPGSSCFPLSPDRRHRSDYKFHADGKSDMLNKIFNIIGTPADAEIVELDREDSKKYLRCFEKRQGTGLQPKFPHVEPGSLDILEKMLKFSPRCRLSVPAALDHPLFAGIRDESRETTAPGLVVLDFEREKDLPESMLRENFYREIKKYHPNVEQGRPSMMGDCVCS
mmetsp:Transcript_1721/g.3892  ORF Transcript_1721/g.3892 Transcript_1721/m.3892 type:complete len:173 (-) Transcript_1721:39-557(-)